MSRRERRRRWKRRIPSDVHEDPVAFLRMVFGAGFGGVARDGDVWAVEVDGLLRPLGKTEDIRYPPSLRRRLDELGVMVGVSFRWDFPRAMLGALRRAHQRGVHSR